MPDIFDKSKIIPRQDFQYLKKIRLFKKRTNIKVKSLKRLHLPHKYVTWMEILAPNILASPLKVSAESVPDDFNVMYAGLLLDTPKR